MATLCGHSSPVLCMDVTRVPAGVLPPPAPPRAAGAPPSPHLAGPGPGGQPAPPPAGGVVNAPNNASARPDEVRLVVIQPCAHALSLVGMVPGCGLTPTMQAFCSCARLGPRL